MRDKILITGGAGFAGTGLVAKLLQEDYEVTCLDILAPNHRDMPVDHERLTHLWKAVQDIEPSDVEGHSTVIHLQAQADVPMGFTSPLWTVDQNVLGITHVLEAVRKVGVDKFIYAGSGNEWGRPLYLPIDEKHPLTPHNPYSFSKAAAELACTAWQRCYDVPVVIMSNGVAVGPDMRKQIFVYIWLKNILEGKPVILEGGDQTRDITFVSDVLDAWMLAIKAPPEQVVGEKFQVSYGMEMSVENILDLCFAVAGCKTEIIRKPHRPGEKGQREFFDNLKARRTLGYEPKINPEEAIRLTWEWIKENDAVREGKCLTANGR